MKSLKVVIAAVCTIALTGCLETSVTDGFVAVGISGEPPSGNTATTLQNGRSGDDFDNFWHCGPVDTVGSYDIVFGANGTGVFKFFNEPLLQMVWDVQNDVVLFALENFSGTTAYSNINFSGANSYSAEFRISNEVAEISNCRRTNLDGSLVTDGGQITSAAAFSNGAEDANIDDLWRCSTASGLTTAIILLDDGSGAIADSSSDDNVVSVVDWTVVAQSVQMDLADGTNASIVDAVFQNANGFTANDITRDTGSFGSASCIRFDLEGNPVQSADVFASSASTATVLELVTRATMHY